MYPIYNTNKFKNEPNACKMGENGEGLNESSRMQLLNVNKEYMPANNKYNKINNNVHGK